MTANKVAFPSLHSTECCAHSASRWLGVLSRGTASWGPHAPGVLDPGSLIAHEYLCVESPSRWEGMHIPALSSGSFQPTLPVGEQWGGTASRDSTAMGIPPCQAVLSSPFFYWCQGCLFKEPMNLPQESIVLGLHVLLIKIAFNF